MTIINPPEPRFSRAAKMDTKDAARWFQRTYSPAVAQQFLGAVEECVASVAEHPEAHPVVYRAFRKALVEGFPYSVYYVYDRSTVQVMAVMHWRRDPQDWQSRAR